MAHQGAIDSVPSARPLSALLSQVLVALTIEIDNTYESRARHRTSTLGGTGPWLISYSMWATILRLVPDEGISAGELSARAGRGRRGLSPKSGMIRWGYVTIDPPGEGARRSPPTDRIVRPTRAGQRASARWAVVPSEVESRWRDRFGSELIDRLRSDAAGAANLAGCTLPAYLPVLGPRLVSSRPASEPRPGPETLVTALANALHAFAIEAEQGWPVGLAAVANPLRVLHDAPSRLADLPRRAGISREATDFASRVLARFGALELGSDPAVGRGRIVALTDDGRDLQSTYHDRLAAVETDWSARQAGHAASLRAGLEVILDQDGGATLKEGLRPPEGTWRARSRQHDELPHFPFVWHRGGFPDGA
jgi:hypothetical protein